MNNVSIEICVERRIWSVGESAVRCQESVTRSGVTVCLLTSQAQLESQDSEVLLTPDY
jgi:hypothetical protein